MRPFDILPRKSTFLRVCPCPVCISRGLLRIVHGNVYTDYRQMLLYMTPSSFKSHIEYGRRVSYSSLRLPIMIQHVLTLWAIAALSYTVTSALPSNSSQDQAEVSDILGPDATNCFPALGFKMPSSTPPDFALAQWWCNPNTEYAFVGFSYEVTACMCPLNSGQCLHLIQSTGQSPDQLKKEFKDIRNHFNSRYVRLYGACDRKGF